MSKISTESDILEWAETIVKGKGEKFIALTKLDSFAIANWVIEAKAMLDRGNTQAAAPAADAETPPPQKEEECPTPQGEDIPDTETPQSSPDFEHYPTMAERDMAESDAPSTFPPFPMYDIEYDKPKTNAERLADKTAQECFDAYLKWCTETKTPAKVMDFSTGKSSTAAGFAWWLAQRPAETAAQ